MTTVQMIPVDRIRVLNPRARDGVRFAEIVENIDRVGLKRPITVSRRQEGEAASDREYDLVCGQGRLDAFIKLGQKEIPAVVLEVPTEDRYLMSLVENIARRAYGPLDLFRQIAVLRERHYTNAQIATKIGVSDAYVSHMLRLLEHGDEQLLRAAERGSIPVNIAIEIAQADDVSVQQSLTEAYDRGELRGRALIKARQLIERRRQREDDGRGGASKAPRKRVSKDEILRVYQRETERQRVLVKKARLFEHRLTFIAGSLRQLLRDATFVRLLKTEKLDEVPTFVVEEVRSS